MTPNKSASVLNQIFILEVTKGHLKWRVSDLARVTGVSRPLIYYHLGKTKSEILNTAIGILTTQFYGLNSQTDEKEMSGPESFIDSLIAAQKLVSQVPAIPIFYLKSRSGNKELKATFSAIEKRFQKKIANYFPRLSNTEIVSVHSILHGIVCAPFATEETIRASLKWLNQLHQMSS